MCPALTIQTPQAIATEAFIDANAAVGRLEEIYERNTQFLRDRFEAYANSALTTRVRANYPLVRITTSTHARLDSRLAYGFVAGPGVRQRDQARPLPDLSY
jgi:AMP nucleosidase